MPFKKPVRIAIVLAFCFTAAGASAREPARGQVVDLPFTSRVLEENRIGLSPERAFKVYLPPGYERGSRRYPVVYFLHNTWWSPRQAFEDGNLQRLLERGFADGVVPEFIFVAADFTGPTTGSMYENSPVTGRWIDYLVNEVVPFVDRSFRTLAQRESRAVVGDFFGGRGALKLAMTNAETFSVAYALHPVAGGSGGVPPSELEIDWLRMHAATSFAELGGLGRTQIFWAIQQAFLPNPGNGACHCDFFFEMRDGQPHYLPDRLHAMYREFLIEGTLAEAAAELRTMRGLALDWGRFDTTRAHVESNRRLSVSLEELGVEHEAEEYRGGPFDRTWTEQGRFATRVLPFLSRHLMWPR